MREFADFCTERGGKEFSSFEQLHDWSVNSADEFWDAVWDYCGIIGEKGDQIIADADKLPGAQFFPQASLSFAENLLRRTGSDPAIIFRGEDKLRLTLSWDDLHAQVSRLQQAFVAHGVKKGDRVAAMLPRRPELVAVILGTFRAGAVYQPLFTAFGPKAIEQRLTDSGAKMVVTDPANLADCS